MSSWANLGVDLHVDLPPGTRGIRDALLKVLRDAVQSGRLQPGTVLPPSRTFAADLGLSRNTVADVYAALVAEGWLNARQGAGTWVGHRPAQAGEAARPRGELATPVHNLMPGSPDVSLFPRAAWLASARRALADAPNEALRLSDPRGRIELRSAVADYLARTRGVRASPDHVMITAGTRHAIQILTAMFGPGRPIAVEAYGLHIFRECIAAAGASTTPIGVDDAGADIRDLDEIDVPAVILTPAHHLPHGVPLAPERRSAAIGWAQRTGGYLLEDDYDGEFRYDRQPVGALQSLDPERVIYLGSASKSLTPVLRLGWMALPGHLVDAAVEAAGGQQWFADGITQLTMADFIRNNNYDKHIRRMRIVYARRRAELAQLLTPFAPEVRISGVAAGLHVLLLLPDGTEPEVLRRAAEAGIGIVGLARLRHPDWRFSTEPDGIVVNFGTPGEHAFPEAIDALCRVLADAFGT